MLGFQFAARLMAKDSGDENLKDTFHFTFVLLLHIGDSVGFGIHKNKDVFEHGLYPLGTLGQIIIDTLFVCLFVLSGHCIIHTGCFFNWYPSKKLKYGKPRLGESTAT